MSNIVQAIVERRKVGSASRKAVLLYMAARSSDDGSGVWTSKANIARDTELAKRTVQYAILDMVADGLLVKVGTRPCRHGETDEYWLQIEAISALESTRATGAPVQQVHPTRATGAPLPVQQVHPNNPLITQEPPLPPVSPPGDEKEKTPYSEIFEKWWDAYPRKTGKGAAFRAFERKRKAFGADRLFDGLEAQMPVLSKQLDGRNDFRPHPATWLNQDRFNDPPPERTKSLLEKIEEQTNGTAEISGEGQDHHGEPRGLPAPVQRSEPFGYRSITDGSNTNDRRGDQRADRYERQQ